MTLVVRVAVVAVVVPVPVDIIVSDDVITDPDVEDVLLFVDCVTETNVCVGVSSIVVSIMVGVGV